MKPARASKIFLYDPDNPPLMDSSVCIGAITKVKDMGVGTANPSSSYSEMRYLLESVAEVRVEPCLQDLRDYTSYTDDIMLWTSTPGAQIKYTIDYQFSCVNLGPLSIGHPPGRGSDKCDRTMNSVLNTDGTPSGRFVSPCGSMNSAQGCIPGEVPARVLPESSATAFVYDQPFSIAYSARVVSTQAFATTALMSRDISDSLLVVTGGYRAARSRIDRRQHSDEL